VASSSHVTVVEPYSNTAVEAGRTLYRWRCSCNEHAAAGYDSMTTAELGALSHRMEHEDDEGYSVMLGAVFEHGTEIPNVIAGEELPMIVTAPLEDEN
jgi:hypothetical protein